MTLNELIIGATYDFVTWLDSTPTFKNATYMGTMHAEVARASGHHIDAQVATLVATRGDTTVPRRPDNHTFTLWRTKSGFYSLSNHAIKVETITPMVIGTTRLELVDVPPSAVERILKFIRGMGHNVRQIENITP